MQKLVFTNGGGQTIDLTSGNFGITNWEGLSGVGLNIQTQQVPFQDGAVFLDALMEQREISVTVAIQDNNDLSLRYELKRQLISALNPKLGEGILVYTNDYLSRQIKAVPQLPIFENKNSNDAGTLKASVTFSCPSPYWEDLEDTVVPIDISSTVIINNEGDIPAQMKIEIESEQNNNIKIINVTEEKLIEYDEQLSGKLYINTNVGQKTVMLENFILKLYGLGVFIRRVISVPKKGIFIIGAEGVILHSIDGVNFIQRNSHTQNDLNDIIYSADKDMLLIVGYGATVITSSDGIEWTLRESGLDTRCDLWGATYSSYLNKFYIGGNSEATITNKGAVSNDGINWTPITVGVSVNSNCCYSDTLHLGVSVSYFSTSIGTTTDLETWTGVSVAGGNKRFVYWAEKVSLFVLGDANGSIYTSANGTSWTLRSASNLGSVYQIGYSETLKKYFALCAGKYILLSDNCIDWSTTPKELDNTVQFISDFVEGGIFILVGANGLIEVSEKLEKFALVQKGINSKVNAILYNQNFSIAVGDNGLIMYRLFENEWKVIDLGITENIVGICYAPDKKLYAIITDRKIGEATNGQNHIFTSNDGLNWTERTSATYRNDVLSGIIYSQKQSRFIAMCVAGYFQSSNGIGWQFTPSNWGGYGLIYSEEAELFIFGIMSGEGKIGYSENIIEFGYSIITPVETTSNIIRSVAIDEARNIIVGVGDNGLIVSSNDRTNSHIRDGHTAENLNKVIFNKTKNRFYAVGNDGVIISSSDGENWQVEWANQTSSINLYDITEKDTEVYMCGDFGLIEESFYSMRNVINNISNDSDMGMNLRIGENRLNISAENNNITCKVQFRQKYIGV
jgi:hypothetical protein